jgi:regulator of cell morphogenesis and NO signaling
MDMTPETHIATLVTDRPATIAVFQRHGIDFCCGGKRSVAAACQAAGLETSQLIAELTAAVAGHSAPEWPAGIGALVGHIQQTYHVPLRQELPRLAMMMEKVVSRHGEHFPEVLLPLQRTLGRLQSELLHHMTKEDAGLFPALVQLEAGGELEPEWLQAPVEMLEAEHADAGAALAEMRRLTGGFMPPPDACPTFKGLYFGLAQLEHDMHLHVHLENNVLFPAAVALARERAGG